jgi:membrane associated rhomboid family serine protease
MNLYVQLFLGLRCEKEWGTRTTAGVYFLSGFGGCLASAVGSPHTVGVGASGAIVGLAGARAAQLVAEWETRDPRQRSQQAWQVALFLFMLGAVGSPAAAAVPGALHVDNFAHGGGLVVGCLAGFALWAWDPTSCCCTACLPSTCRATTPNLHHMARRWATASPIQRTAAVSLFLYFAVLIGLLASSRVEDASYAC